LPVVCRWHVNSNNPALRRKRKTLQAFDARYACHSHKYLNFAMCHLRTHAQVQTLTFHEGMSLETIPDEPPPFRDCAESPSNPPLSNAHAVQLPAASLVTAPEILDVPAAAPPTFCAACSGH